LHARFGPTKRLGCLDLAYALNEKRIPIIAVVGAGPDQIQLACVLQLHRCLRESHKLSRQRKSERKPVSTTTTAPKAAGTRRSAVKTAVTGTVAATTRRETSDT
jgi:hypothetical protein